MAQAFSITSIKDERVAEARELTAAAGRARLGKTLLEGEESIFWALEAGLVVEHVFIAAHARAQEWLAAFQSKGIACYTVSEGIMKKISDTSYLVPVLGVARLPAPPASLEAASNFVLVLDRVQDHGNLGTIIRTASAFGIRDVVATTPGLDIYFKKIISASRGKAFEAQVYAFSSASAALDALKERGYQIVATSPHARALQSMAALQPKPLALVVGNETEGISDEIIQQADVVVQIPMSGLVESLNVGVATGISLYELKYRMVLTMLSQMIKMNFGREVNVTGQMIMRAFDHALSQVGDLNALQVVLLMQLACDRQMSLEQAGRDTASFGDELEQLLQPLLDKRYIALAQPGEKDAFTITEEGERALAQLWGVVEKSSNDVLAGFSAQEKTQLLSYLQRIQANCEHICAE
ncbi:MAG TPA: RNA methyltransferase [Ktedonobacteraceae bacterium]|nr:RNA methyltransferase [Ktedonobacteraceae bacterium]